MSSQILSTMLFAEKIRQLREDKQLLQRQVSAALEIDNALYCKIERGDRLAKREQVVKLAQLFAVDSKALLVLWLADKINATVVEEKELALDALSIVEQSIKK
ncbi:transcriptional regulator with XRE-family HTH domain [Parabacteroides sp. PF5-5]|uniref:helix-turn-helix domain-containing protein n=1 Tax=unclassified Parabacteroides TaxID=2649774 RepID=UPI00247E3323|nr:transcriptional regulator with XRE-family HTH domain [Parabacteroides sp. PH5-39]MDH6312374.1 transcriptional regulator with XRE-family HTH domain [Parabacteroides sp. PFB2-10]MDH6315074.1 transcriptional regulator with XRE-family HTH domain [Parabacteroides sp. PF5-13]MDH6318734.1 transcriptional regulator with XRE-family HTH domain [Parabacteroides sp. PH5-13]MDH6322464.1 transcriptional regulator with XRE-family HTH domain [Parabacteroides sp. PH5-8]MDH6326401.1 transcriptional regulator